MSVILIGGEKGGTGKSTIATNMAIMSKIMGHDVILIDTDRQASSSKFMEYRKEKQIHPTPSSTILRGKYLHEEIQDFACRYEVVIIDAGGRDSVELRSAMASPVVTSLYSPLKPSEFDLDTLSTMDDLVYLSKSYNSNLIAFITFNQAPTHSKITITDEAKEYTKNFENIGICQTIIGHRVPIQYATSKAQAVIEFELEKIQSMPSYQAKKYQPKSSLEMCTLYKEIFNEEFKNQLLEEFRHLLKDAT